MKKMFVSIIILSMLLTSLPVCTIGEDVIYEKQDKMLIISVDIFASTLQRFIDFKNEHGVKTFFKDVNEIYNEYKGRDKPEQIKYFIKDAIETLDISYVLLVGSNEYIPIRKTSDKISNDLDSPTYLPTDLYYADIYTSSGVFCSWDSNNNNIFGESSDSNNVDGVDFIEDVYIDRISCDSNEELNKVIDDLIYYENYAYNDVKNIYQNSVLNKEVNCLSKNIESNLQLINKKCSTNEYDMVIISKNFYRSTIQPLIDHKNSHGLKTFFKDVDEIYGEYPGRDKPEQIKYFIKDMIETKGISYVLLIGGINQVPMRKFTYYQFDMKKYSASEVLSDLYYADIYNDTGGFCSWDSNNNNLFGEFFKPNGSLNYHDDKNIDEVDLYADVHIGRIPCLFTHDLEIIIDKIINYENYAYGADWFKKILLLGGDWPSFDYGGEYVTNCVGNEMQKHGFENIKLWASKKNLRPLIVNYNINQGAGFISYTGHGMPFGLTTNHYYQNFRYWNNHLLGLHNQDKLPIVFFDACSTAQLNFVVSPFAYNIVRKANGGAIASIASTNIVYSYVYETGINAGSSYLNLHFFMNYEEGTTVGEMLTKAQYDYLNNVYKDTSTLGEFILIGDPSLKVGGYGQSQQGDQQSNLQSSLSSSLQSSQISQQIIGGSISQPTIK